MNLLILIISKAFFLFSYFLCQTDDADPDPGLTEDVWHQKYENKKDGFYYFKEYSFDSILKIPFRLTYKALDPGFGQIRNHITAKKG